MGWERKRSVVMRGEEEGEGIDCGVVSGGGGRNWWRGGACDRPRGGYSRGDITWVGSKERRAGLRVMAFSSFTLTRGRGSLRSVPFVFAVGSSDLLFLFVESASS